MPVHAGKDALLEGGCDVTKVKKQKAVKPPKYQGCNGRPQLWHSLGTEQTHDRLRIIYPSGVVEYCHAAFPGGFVTGPESGFNEGCTTRPTQKHAVQAAKAFSRLNDYEDFVFLGYL